MGNPNITHYAVLIGIDDYPDKPLKSCVRDVQDTKTYIESVLHDVVEIQTFVTSQIKPGPRNVVDDQVL
jgi:hypothetical protein